MDITPSKPDFVPADRPTITPRIVTREVEALVDFIRRVFDAQGEAVADRPSDIWIGECLIMVSDGGGVLDDMPAFLYVHVRDTDEAYRRAVEAGAESIEAPAQQFYGDRRATVRDRWGNLWQIATRTGPVA